MGQAKENDVYKQELLDDDKAVDAAGQAAARKGNVGSHRSGFTYFLLKPELLRAIQDCGLETRPNAWSNGPPKFLFDGRPTRTGLVDYEKDNKAAAKPAAGHAAPRRATLESTAPASGTLCSRPARTAPSSTQRTDKVVNAAAKLATGHATPNEGYDGIHNLGFRDFLLKPELLRAIQDCSFEHPSEEVSLND
ncbi:uncharacterized protein [Triticum aestivum]|uniref:uncharacterized protein n=1 Tax=Triticum aestivum TaxID=4565 RepID=UPI001D00EEB4|nr:uncharacterized protein LOC123154816 [Triticum aestivum]